MSRSDALEAFARAYTRRMPEDEAPPIDGEQLRAAVEYLFDFVDDRRRSPFAIRVFNPTVGSCGYRVGGSVLEVVIDDMPFLIDSVTSRIRSLGHTIVRHYHPVVGTTRDASGALVGVGPGRDADCRESVQHYELAQTLSARQRADLEAGVVRTLEEVAATVRDFEPMRFAVRRMAHYVFEDGEAFDRTDVEEAVAFLEWLLDDNFILLGYREYQIGDEGGEPAIVTDPDSGYGILSDPATSRFTEPVPLSALPTDLRERYEHGRQLVISKTNGRSTIHREARMDYVGVRRVNADGTPRGEARLVGLFTSKAYMEPSATIPILRRKLRNILAEEDLLAGSHDYKVITQIFESFPKDELFAISEDDLRSSLVGLLEAEEHQHVRLFVRRDVLRRNISILVVVPRDRFDANLRRNLQDLFLQRYEGVSIDYQLTLGETGDARIHFTVWVEGSIPDVPFEDLERDVYALTRTWEDRVVAALASTFDPADARAMVDAHARRYPSSFRIAANLGEAAHSVADVHALLSADERIRVGIHNEAGSDEPLTRIVVYSRDGMRDLSEMLPLIENLGVRVIEEIPTSLAAEGEPDTLFAHDFGVVGFDGEPLDVAGCGPRVAAALTATLMGESESDRLSRLLVLTDLDHKRIHILRAYRSYWHLVNPAFSKPYVAKAFAAHPDIARDLIRLFEARFGPAEDSEDETDLRVSLLERLEAVGSLDEDRILRGFLGLIDATVRTSAYLDNGTLAFKLVSSLVPDVPEPRPLYEIFVFAPDVAGIHLRGGAVARGGIRWSIRREDYRTEVLGLMKAQMTKNVVIVPTGAKGGFVLRRPADPVSGPTLDEVKSGYQTFIRGLLDVTDNLDGGVVIHPAGVRTLDGDDPYFVVAADRGTATFSDTANQIATDAGFWLDDAFASGGSSGYDHKALGITARGAWESVRRHFAELDVDVQTDPITVVGVGDMSGDVFGNGMLLSGSIKLVAAFDHRHIFIDPTPDPAASLLERARLAGLGRSSWDDYNRDAISPGGGVFARSAKRIDLTDEMREVFNTSASEMTPQQLISAIIKAPVDLFWNGGIGTYVKASTETNDDAQDRANDAVRISGRDLRCRVVGEGGNLGFTQAGRIEYDRAGGRIFTDFVDNSGGVHCSDREVNIKILLRMAERSGALSRDDRNELIEAVSDDVVDAIVYDNFLQAQILSQETAVSGERIEAYEDLMVRLEAGDRPRSSQRGAPDHRDHDRAGPRRTADGEAGTRSAARLRQAASQRRTRRIGLAGFSILRASACQLLPSADRRPLRVADSRASASSGVGGNNRRERDSQLSGRHVRFTPRDRDRRRPSRDRWRVSNGAWRCRCVGPLEGGGGTRRVDRCRRGQRTSLGCRRPRGRPHALVHHPSERRVDPGADRPLSGRVRGAGGRHPNHGAKAMAEPFGAIRVADGSTRRSRTHCRGTRHAGRARARRRHHRCGSCDGAFDRPNRSPVLPDWCDVSHRLARTPACRASCGHPLAALGDPRDGTGTRVAPPYDRRADPHRIGRR